MWMMKEGFPEEMRFQLDLEVHARLGHMERQAQAIPGKPGGKLGKVEEVPGHVCGSSGPEQRVPAVEKMKLGC